MIQIFNNHPGLVSDGLGLKANFNITEYRLYGWVPYNVKPIQAGIQFGHAGIRLMLDMFNREDLQDQDQDIIEWATNNETFIILNGGPTRSTLDYGMSVILSTLKIMETKFENAPRLAVFREPDLNDALSGIVLVLKNSAFDKHLLTEEALTLCYSVFMHKILNGPQPTDEAILVWNAAAEVIGEYNLAMQCWLPQFNLWS